MSQDLNSIHKSNKALLTYNNLKIEQLVAYMCLHPFERIGFLTEAEEKKVYEHMLDSKSVRDISLLMEKPQDLIQQAYDRIKTTNRKPIDKVAEAF